MLNQTRTISQRRKRSIVTHSRSACACVGRSPLAAPAAPAATDEPAEPAEPAGRKTNMRCACPGLLHMHQGEEREYKTSYLRCCRCFFDGSFKNVCAAARTRLRLRWEKCRREEGISRGRDGLRGSSYRPRCTVHPLLAWPW